MNRRDFLKKSSLTALLAAGEWTCLPSVWDACLWWGYYGGKYDKKEMISLIRRAYEQGVTLSSYGTSGRPFHLKSNR